MDSVGVVPSSRLFKAVIPFDGFQSVALAPARFSGGPEAMPITLTLFDDKGVRVGSADQALAPSQHTAKFLYQFFPAVSSTRRVEIRSSDRPFIGTALLLPGGPGVCAAVRALHDSVRGHSDGGRRHRDQQHIHGP